MDSNDRPPSRSAARRAEPIRHLVLGATIVAIVATSIACVDDRSEPDISAAPSTPPTVEPAASLSPQALDGGFERAGALVVPRYNHRAVLLQDGRVLVIGGETEGGQMPSEVYDPATGAFTAVGPIASHDDQDSFTTTVLADGRVLVAGGRMVEGRLDLPWPASDEAVIFDPRNGGTRPTGRMTIGREYHQATLLADGRVLVVGGSSGWLEPNEGPSILATAEVYDPATETFSPVGRSACARANDIPDTQLSTTLLPSGRVLVRGGTSGDQCQNPDGSLLDEIFDPWTGTFASVHVRGPVEVASVVLLHPDLVLRYDLRTGTPTDITPQPAALVRKFGAKCRELRWGCRSGMTTTRLTDGRVLLAGGSVYADSGERRVPQVAAELLDPGSGVVVRTGPLVEPRRGHTATLLADGRILLIGGVAADRDSGLEAARSIVAAEIFTPAS